MAEEKNPTVRFNGEDREYNVYPEASMKEDHPKYFIRYVKGKVWISDKVPEKFRKYMVLHELDEYEKSGTPNKRKLCADALKGELENISKGDIKEYVPFRTEVFEDLSEFIQRRLSDPKEKPEYIETYKVLDPEVKQSLRYLKGIMLKEHLHNYVQKREGEEKERSHSGLEKKATGTVAILGLAFGLIFLSSGLTGNVVGNMASSTSNWIGGALFVLGLIGALFYFKNR